MTAAETPTRPLGLVTDPDDTSGPPDPSDEWRSQTVIDQYSPEHQFVGSLMWLSADQGRTWLSLVPDTAIWRPQTRRAYQLIRRLIDTGTDPTPVAVLAAARHSARDAAGPDTTLTAHHHQQLALYLFDAYAQAVAPAAAIKSYARAVLDQAYRRAFDTCGVRMQQLAHSGADPDQLDDELTAICAELDGLRRRAEAAARSDHRQP